uniref:Protein white n=1 Tax=Limnogonus franciscanus TaxID=913166 RepID=A0A5C1YTI5_9HEMI|nr:white [Limnogonus franciscanus]
MTGGHDEREPLLITANGNGSKVTYKAVSDLGKDDDFTLTFTPDGKDSSGRGSPGSPDKGPLSSRGRDSITYTWSDICVHVAEETSSSRRRSLITGQQARRHPTGRKEILKKVTGAAYPGELLAIMGSSGAGKTTLLNTLMFRSGAGVEVSGYRALNGVPVDRNTLAALSAYVQQDDLFIGTLTVREHLIFQALVRMDRHIPYETRMCRVEEVISELTLTKCQNTIIGVPGKLKGISGGEMKRLSFASEVLTNPPLMFCDEPTSGLDSFMALNVVTVLKSLAMKGKTVVCTIHQPSSEVYSMFDKILLMAEGRVAFLGTPNQANQFFAQMGAACPSTYNPADFFIQLLAVVPTREETCRNTIDMVCDSFQHSEIGVNLAAQAHISYQEKGLLGWGEPWGTKSLHVKSPYKASWWAQFRAVLWRSWLSVKKEPVLIKVRVLQTLMVALMIGIIYFGQKLDQDGVMNINGAIYVCITNMTFQNVFAVISVFCSELPVFMREHQNGMYRTDVYFLCKTLAEVPIFLFIPIMFTVVMYYMVGLNPDPVRFMAAGAIFTLISNVATSFGYFISCISSSISVALSIGPPIIIPFLLFGGFFLNSGSVPWYFEWLSNLSWFRYGNEALLINQWEDVDYISCSRTNTTCPRDGHVVLETYNFDEGNYLKDYLCLFGLIMGFRTLAYFALLGRTYTKRGT